LNKTYKDWKQNKATIFNVEDDILELPTGVDKVKLIENATKENEDKKNKSEKKVFRAMRKLESWFNPEATKAVEDYSHGREMTLDQVNSALFYTVTVKEPTTYEEAINGEKKEDQIKWKSAIKKN
jgi:FtsZ-interacting cell division protein YlmF